MNRKVAATHLNEIITVTGNTGSRDRLLAASRVRGAFALLGVMPTMWWGPSSSFVQPLPL